MCAPLSRWPRRLRRRSVVARLLISEVRIPLRLWTSVSGVCFVLCMCVCVCVCVCSGVCDELIARSGDSYRSCVCLIVCDLETTTTRRPRPEFGHCVAGKEKLVTCHLYEIFEVYICRRAIVWRYHLKRFLTQVHK
jgi:hypothetical protein